jgi:hypothetical protein
MTSLLSTLCFRSMVPLPSIYIILDTVVTGDHSDGLKGVYSIKSFISYVKCVLTPELSSHIEPISEGNFPLHFEHKV